jgi:hypothetical protein
MVPEYSAFPKATSGFAVEPKFVIFLGMNKCAVWPVLAAVRYAGAGSSQHRIRKKPAYAMSFKGWP